MSVRRPAALRPLVLSVVFIAACGEGSAGPDASRSTVQRLLIEPFSARVAAPGDSARYEAFTVLGDGSRRSVDAAWSSDRSDVVRLDQRGVATAVTEGSAIIEATYEGFGATAVFVVNSDTIPPALRTVFATPERVGVSFGTEEVRVEAEFEDRSSGVGSAVATFDGPLGPVISGFVILDAKSDSIGPGGIRISVVEGILPIPGLSAVGTWTMSGLTATDGSGNTGRWGAADLARLGLTVEVVVTVDHD